MSKGFAIVCLECGCTECEQHTYHDYGYDGEDEYIIDGEDYFLCPDCGQCSLTDDG